MKYKICVPETPVWWCSPFLGSNDHIDFLDEIIAHLRSLGEEMELVSVIGGMKFFQLMELLDFSRVTVFDKNFNEMTKFILANEYFQRTEYEEYDGFCGLKDFIHSHPADFYLPFQATLETGPKFFVKSGEQTVPSFSVLNPVDFPHFQWRPSQDAYQKVRGMLRTNLNPNLYFDVPELDCAGRVVVVFLSHCEIPIQVLEKKFTNCKVVVPIQARPMLHDGSGEFFHEEPVNQEVAEAHPYWLCMVNKYKRGTSVHVWPPELGFMQGRFHDRHFTKGLGTFKFLKNERKFDTVVTHIFFGKSQERREDRTEVFRSVLRKAKKVGDRLIITDFNKASGQFEHLNLPTAEEIVEMVREMVEPEFKISEITYSAAGNRELGIIVDRV
jgi:hypothetical protein